MLQKMFKSCKGTAPMTTKSHLIPYSLAYPESTDWMNWNGARLVHNYEVSVSMYNVYRISKHLWEEGEREGEEERDQREVI